MEATIYNLPIISSILARTNRKAEKMGVVAVMKNVMERTRTEVKIIENKNTKKALKNEAVLVISNHPAEADVPVLLSALEEREDVYLIASHHFLKILPSVDDKVIPVYISHRIDKKHGWKLRIFNKIHRAEILPREMAHKKNIESVRMAGEKINNGGVVVIYPAAEEINYQFMSGVGHLVCQLQNPKIKVVMAYIEGTSNWDYLRIFGIITRWLPKLKVTFSEPIEIKKFKSIEGKETAKKMEKYYYEWVKSLGLTN